MAKYVGVPDIAKWKQEWKGGKYKQQVEDTTAQAENIGFSGTPSFSIEGPKSNGLELLGTPGSTEAIEEKIEKAS
jgi:protein-disulfide isomerase